MGVDDAKEADDVSVWQLAWKMPVGATVADLRVKLDALEEALDCSATCWYDRGLVWAELGTQRLPELVEFGTFCQRSAAEVEGMGLPIPLGESKVGRLWADLEAIVHLLVGGTTGAGKSVFLRQLVIWLVTRYTATRLRLVLVDLKGGMEFNAFRELPHLLYPVVSELEDCEIAFGLVSQEMDRRQRMFAAAGVENLPEWNATRPGGELPWLVLVVDEFGELRAADAPRQSAERGRRDAVHALISRAGRIGRAVGVHLIVCTQRPDADTVTPQLRAQLPATLALHCVTDTNSRVLLDSAAAADLPPRPGRAIWQWDRVVEVQLPLLEKAEARALLAAYEARGGGEEELADAA
jgi:DNA segregation ATPase FtsK/SpoIIIE-like protein